MTSKDSWTRQERGGAAGDPRPDGPPPATGASAAEQRLAEQRLAEQRAAADLPDARTRGIRFVWVLALIALDLWSKWAVFAWLTPTAGEAPAAGVEVWHNGHLRYTLVDPWLGFMLGENLGAAWGFGADYPYLLLAGRVGAVVLITVLLWRAARRPLTHALALVLVLAGAVGNLVDNIFRRDDTHPIGAVRDFIDVYFPIWQYHFPTFNVADSCITVGAVLLIWGGLFGGRGETTRAADPAPPPAAK